MANSHDQSRLQELPQESEERDKGPPQSLSQPTQTLTEIPTTNDDKQGAHQSTQVLPPESRIDHEMQDSEMQNLIHPDTAIPTREVEEPQTVTDALPDQPDNLHDGNRSRLERVLAVPDQPSSQGIQLLSRHAPTADIPVFPRRTPADRSSAPPEPLGTLRDQEGARRLKYLDRFSADILPPPTAPLYLQIITYIQRWGIWATTVSDEELRDRLIKVMADKMENIWLEGMRRGLIPQTADALLGGAANTMALGDGQTQQSAHELAAQIMAGPGRGRQPQQQTRRKRPVSPSKVVVLCRPKRKDVREYGITAGELREAGVTVDMIQERVSSGDLDEDDDLMNDILEQVDREQLLGDDWLSVLPRTKINTMGRDLEIFCLWEVQNSRHELKTLHHLMERFTHSSQIKNTQTRINEEEKLMNRFHALALILHDRETQSSRASSSPVQGVRGEADEGVEVTSARPGEENEIVDGKDGSSSELTPEPSFDAEKGDANTEAGDNKEGLVMDEQLGAKEDEQIARVTSDNSGDRQQSELADGNDDVIMAGAEDPGAKAKWQLVVDDTMIVSRGFRICHRSLLTMLGAE